ncbi:MULTISPECIES: type II toxin-antitoxin system ParD family antitoxin [Methylobacteriaceae]|nr:type II toxin-antitoxin system ParD family antitoxin [Methylobacterium sp. B4]
MNVSLPPELLSFVDELTRSGGYASASEVVREGLRLLEQEKAAEAERLAILKREVEGGLDDLRADRFSDRTAASIAQAVMRKAGRAP